MPSLRLCEAEFQSGKLINIVGEMSRQHGIQAMAQD